MSDGEIQIWAGGVVLLVSAGVGVIPLALGWRVAVRRKALLARMHQTNGYLDECEIGPPVSEENFRVPYRYPIVMRYRYTVNGADLVGHRFNLDLAPWWNSLAEAYKAIGGLTVGESVIVWYDPDDPATAVLSKAPPRDLPFFRVSTTIAGILAAAGAVLMLLGSPM